MVQVRFIKKSFDTFDNAFADYNSYGVAEDHAVTVAWSKRGIVRSFYFFRPSFLIIESYSFLSLRSR